MAGSRRARSVSSLPQPRDCVLSAWSSWSNCDPCQKKRVSVHGLGMKSEKLGGRTSSKPCIFGLWSWAKSGELLRKALYR